MSETEREPWVDANAVATHLSVSRDWVYDAAKRGVIPSQKVGGHRRFLLSEIDAHLLGEELLKHAISANAIKVTSIRGR